MNEDHLISTTAPKPITITSNNSSSKVHRRKNEKMWRKYTDYYAPDGGWAWLVLLGQFTISMLFSSVGPLFGLVFLHLVKQLELSSVAVAWIFSLQAFVWNISGIMAGPLCKEFGWRPVAMTGSFLASLGLILTCYATSSIPIFATFSVLLGFGGSLAYTTGNFILPHYFVARRGLAIAIASSGISFGGFILPLLIGYLQEIYGFHGTAVIFSAITLHAFLGAMLFHPLHWHTRRIKSETETSQAEERNTLMNQPQKIDQAPIGKRSALKNMCAHFNTVATTVFKQTVKNVATLKSPVVFILSVSGSVYIIAFLNVMMMIPFTLMERSFDLPQITYCLSMCGAFNLVARLTLPTMSDYSWFNKTICYVGGICCVGASTLAFTFARTFEEAATTLSVMGAGIGASMGLQSLILIEYKSLDKLPATYGAFAFVSAVAFIVVGPLIGLIRDKTGSYDISNTVLSGILFFAAAIWIFMPAAITTEKRKVQTETTEAVA